MCMNVYHNIIVDSIFKVCLLSAISKEVLSFKISSKKQSLCMNNLYAMLTIAIGNWILVQLHMHSTCSM